MTATRSKKAEQLKNEENASKVEESKEIKDEKTEEVSDEDKQLQDELVLCVERLKDSNVELRYNSLKILADKIRSATSSLTSVPKPLKFLRPHWDAIVASFEAYGSKEKSHTAWFLHAEIISVLGMTSGDEKELNCLKYRVVFLKYNF